MKHLILLPNTLHEESTWEYKVPKIDALIAESEKGGRHFLKRFGAPLCPVYLLNEHSKDPAELLKIPEDVVGLISDAGLPCLADPGAQVVALACKRGISIDAIPGPSSLMMALQLSGFSGQAFTFHGYFPREEKDLAVVLKRLAPGYTHMFIETPYRTQKLFELLLKLLQETAKLCVAFELMGPASKVRTDTVRGWKKSEVSFSKGRAVFLISS
jgi:16S rRNA (cytidine1402-2'-O)-methyltransferase